MQLPYLGKSQNTKNDKCRCKQHIVLWINNVKQYFIYLVLSIQVSVRQAHNKCSQCGSIDTLCRRVGRYDWSATGQWQTALCVCQRETENVEDLVLSQEDNPKTHRLNPEISRETGIHWLSVHKIIYRDLQLNCVKRRRAQQLSETNRVARLTRCKQLL